MWVKMYENIEDQEVFIVGGKVKKVAEGGWKGGGLLDSLLVIYFLGEDSLT